MFTTIPKKHAIPGASLTRLLLDLCEEHCAMLWVRAGPGKLGWGGHVPSNDAVCRELRSTSADREMSVIIEMPMLSPTWRFMGSYK